MSGKSTLTLFLSLVSVAVFGQARMMINNNAYVVMDGGVFIVLDNANANAMSTLGSGGNLVSEDEDNKVRWNIGTTTGTYTLPYTSSPAGTNTKMPFTFQVTTGGTGSGRVDFSTYETSTDGNAPFPSMVTHMNDATDGTTNNSLFVMDRYWIVDAQNYTVKPTTSMTFGYVDNASELGGTNTITEASLRAQRFDDGNGIWGMVDGGSFPIYGTVNTTTNVVSGVAPAPADLFAAWVLVDDSSPLPIELLSFDASCNNGVVDVMWITASESNNAYFTVERSVDNFFYETIGTVAGANNSTSALQYSFVDENPLPGVSYYRLRQTDFDQLTEVFEPKSVESCDDGSFDVTVLQNGTGHIGVGVITDSPEDLVVNVYDLSGRLVHHQGASVVEGYNLFDINNEDLVFGFYMLNIEGKEDRFSQKVLLK